MVIAFLQTPFGRAKPLEITEISPIAESINKYMDHNPHTMEPKESRGRKTLQNY